MMLDGTSATVLQTQMHDATGQALVGFGLDRTLADDASPLGHVPRGEGVVDGRGRCLVEIVLEHVEHLLGAVRRRGIPELLLGAGAHVESDVRVGEEPGEVLAVERFDGVG